MGKKKSKEKSTATSPTNDAVPPKASVFTSIFGDNNSATAEQNGVASLFSDNNPFKRKPQTESPVTENDDAIKAVKEPKRRSIEDVEIPVEKKKTKIEENRNDVDGELVSNEGVLGMKRKKRKRDELELEYEGKRYGVVAETGGEEVKKKKVGEKRKKVDDPADMMVSKEGFDDESKLLRTVFVGNLPLDMKKKKLVKEFSGFGDVESVRIRSVPLTDTKKPRKGAIMQKQINDSVGSVNAYVVFKSEESAQASLSHNMAVVGGNHIRVDRACPPRKKLKGESTTLFDHKRTVFVGNLPFDVKDEEVYQLFCSISGLESSIEAIRVVRDQNINIGKGIAYVLLKTKEAANKLVKKRNLRLRGRDLRLSNAKADATPTKRKRPSTENAYNPPSKRSAIVTKTPESSNRFNVKSPMSYQGMRASKSGSSKKFQSKRAGSGPGSSMKTQKVEKSKEPKGKRPAVAARKAKQLAAKGGATSQSVGKKRKMESRTPESGRWNKKSKRPT